MTSHWLKYKKCVLKFPDDIKRNPKEVLPMLKLFLSENDKIFVDYRLWMDYADKKTKIHVNFYLKCKDWNKLRRDYQPPLHKDGRFYLYIDDLNDINDTSDWISYSSMRQKVNYEPFITAYNARIEQMELQFSDSNDSSSEECGAGVTPLRKNSDKGIRDSDSHHSAES